MKRRIAPVVASGVALMFALAACAPTSGGTGEVGDPQQGGSLTLVRADDVQSLVPTVAADNASIWTLQEIFDTLLVPSEDGQTLEPSLATEYTQSDDKLSWTFTLRDDVEFSNGQPLTSADVKFSLEEASKPENPFSFINAIISSIDAPDDHTVVITTSQPWAPLPADLALYANSIVPADYAGMSKEEFADSPIGTGPFTLESWTSGDTLTLKRNDNYWQDGLPYLDSVTINVVSDSNTRATQLESGQAQINEYPAYSSLAALKASSNVQVEAFPSSRVDYLTMNTSVAPFDDENVRLAIAHAVDREAIIKTVLFGNGTLPGGYMSPALWAYDDSIEPPAYDLDAAKEALANSSVPDGFDASILVTSGNADQQTEAQLIQDSLSKIGITVSIDALDPAAGIDAVQNGNFDMTFVYQTTDIIDPDEIIRWVGLADGGSNAEFSFYDAGLGDLAAEAATLSDQDARKAIYSEMQKTFNEANPLLTLYYSQSLYSFANNVHDFHPFATGNYNLVDTWISQ
jgi:peptide/nickel transport system substrate-binding protein